uniref:Uncharacterized protein n=1 Tax=Oncorhynchus mykiss TaxID=8022 RepID=A0A8C7RKL9_ONCMY
MPKNKGKGVKKRRRGKYENESERETVFKEDSQEYAQKMFFLLLNVLQWCAFMNTTPVLLSHSLHTHTHTHHGYLPGLWDAVLHDACHVSDGEVDVLLPEVLFHAPVIMVVQTLLSIIFITRIITIEFIS